MIVSFIVSDMISVTYLINTFSEIIDGYTLERNPATGEPELLVLYVTEGREPDAWELKELVETMALSYQTDSNATSQKVKEKTQNKQ